MDLFGFKKDYILKQELNIDIGAYGRIMAIVDFGNVNYWFNKDNQDANLRALSPSEKLRINIDGLKYFINLFTNDLRIYYGHDSKYLSFIIALKTVFGKSNVFTKPIQKVRHHLTDEEMESNSRDVFTDSDGSYVFIHKCNFDVEISVDCIRLMEKYDTLALFSGDADFVSLIRFLKKNNKKVILFKAGYITSDLRKNVDIVVNAQSIKKHITEVYSKQKPA